MPDGPKDVALALLLGWTRWTTGHLSYWKRPIRPSDTSLPYYVYVINVNQGVGRGDNYVFADTATLAVQYDTGQVTPEGKYAK